MHVGYLCVHQIVVCFRHSDISLCTNGIIVASNELPHCDTDALPPPSSSAVALEASDVTDQFCACASK